MENIVFTAKSVIINLIILQRTYFVRTDDCEEKQ